MTNKLEGGRIHLNDGLAVNYLNKALNPTPAKAPASPEPLQKGLTVNHLSTALGTTGQTTQGSSTGAAHSAGGGSDKK